MPTGTEAFRPQDEPYTHTHTQAAHRHTQVLTCTAPAHKGPHASTTVASKGEVTCPAQSTSCTTNEQKTASKQTHITHMVAIG